MMNKLRQTKIAFESGYKGPELRVVEGTSAEPGHNYRPDIDGLRAIAVLSVVIFHLFPHLLPGGFIGVDIFFVISGYLISSILYKDLKANRFSFKNFYSRRIKRIFPTLLLVLIVVAVFGWLLFLPSEYVALTKSMKYTSVFANNWHFYRTADYFDTNATLKPLLHLWSLSIEEQFYIFFPMLILGLYKYAYDWTRAVLFAGLIVSFALNVLMLNEYPQQVFYMLPYRAWELLLGALFAHYMINNDLQPIRSSNLASWVGIALIGLVCFWLSSDTPFPGWWALFPTVGAVLLIASPYSWVNRTILAHPLSVWVGLISYSLYLWHWPLISFAHIMGHASTAISIVIFAASFILAAATTFMIERPIRKGSNRWIVGLCVPMLILGIATSIVSKFPIATYPMIGQHDENLNKFVDATEDWDHKSSNLVFKPERGFPFRTFGQGSHVVMFLGDSNMKQYWPRVEQVLKDPELASTYTALFATRHGQFPCPGYDTTQAANDFFADVETCLNDHRVQTVVIGASWIGYEDKEVEKRQKRYNDVEDMIKRIRARGKRVFLILNIPVEKNVDPLQRLDRGFFYARPCYDLSFPLENYMMNHRSTIERLTGIAERTGCLILDPALTMCPNGQCQLLHGDQLPTYKDGCHLTATYVREHATFIDKIFTRRL